MCKKDFKQINGQNLQETKINSTRETSLKRLRLRLILNMRTQSCYDNYNKFYKENKHEVLRSITLLA